MFTWTSSYKDPQNIFTLVHLDLTIHHTGKAGTWRSTERPSCYRPQTKFAKVMFSQVSVCPRGVWQTPPGQVHPLGRYTPWAGIAPGQVHPPGKVQPPQAGTSPWAGTPPLGQVYPPGRYILLGRYTPGRYTPPCHGLLLPHLPPQRGPTLTSV